jgi:transcription termination factor Rho
VDEINDFIKQTKEYKKVREDKYKQDSRDRLSKIIKKKVETTMIGALSSIEQHFGFLWENKNGKLTSEQQIMFDLYQKVRSEILDKGNTQSRNIDAELSQYDINWMRYSANIPVK